MIVGRRLFRLAGELDIDRLSRLGTAPNRNGHFTLQNSVVLEQAAERQFGDGDARSKQRDKKDQ